LGVEASAGAHGEDAEALAWTQACAGIVGDIEPLVEEGYRGADAMPGAARGEGASPEEMLAMDADEL
jgi:hypothetical protein